MRPSGQDMTALYALVAECHQVSFNQSLGLLVGHANIVGQNPQGEPLVKKLFQPWGLFSLGDTGDCTGWQALLISCS